MKINKINLKLISQLKKNKDIIRNGFSAGDKCRTPPKSKQREP